MANGRITVSVLAKTSKTNRKPESAAETHEYTNLAGVPSHQDKLIEMRELGIQMINDKPTSLMSGL